MESLGIANCGCSLYLGKSLGCLNIHNRRGEPLRKLFSWLFAALEAQNVHRAWCPCPGHFRVVVGLCSAQLRLAWANEKDSE